MQILQGHAVTRFPGISPGFLGILYTNIATMQVYRDERGGHAVMVIEVDQQLPEGCIERLEQEEGIEKVIYLCMD